GSRACRRRRARQPSKRPIAFDCYHSTSLMEAALGWVTQYGAISLFFLMMLGIVGLPIPDETLLVFSGYLIYRGTLNPLFTFTMAFLGAMCGITVSYF